MQSPHPPRPAPALPLDHFHPANQVRVQTRNAHEPSGQRHHRLVSDGLKSDEDEAAVSSGEMYWPTAPREVLGQSTIPKNKTGASHATLASRAGQYSAGLVQKARSMVAGLRGRPIDTLAELAEAGRYCAVSNRLAAVAVLTDQEKLWVRQNTPDRRMHQTGTQIVSEGDAAPSPMFIASGWACRTRRCANGRRQIIGFLLPGDPIGLHGARTSLSYTSIFALTSVETVDAIRLLKMANDPSQYPGIGNAIDRLHLLEESFLVNQIARLANSSYEARVAHLLLELQWRLQQTRLASGDRFPLCLSDSELGDALAIGQKGARKTLNVLRRRNILRYRYGCAEIRRRNLLYDMSGFCPPIYATKLGRITSPVSDYGMSDS